MASPLKKSLDDLKTFSPHSTLQNNFEDVDSFDLDEDEEDVLLDWERYGLAKKYIWCGVDWSPLAKKLPWIVPPEWWYRISKRQKKIVQTGIACLGVVLLTILIFTIFMLARGSSAKTGHDANEQAIVPSSSAVGGKDSVDGEGSSGALVELVKCEWDENRLPGWVKPREYRLDLSVDLGGEDGVDGVVEIDVDVVESTHCIVLHSKQMNVSSVELKGTGEKGRIVANDTKSWQIVVEFPKLITSSTATLVFRFSYNLGTALSGLYRSTYQDEEARTLPFVNTQFEATSARKAFPCFDEPNLKAVFALNLTTSDELQALSNMPKVSEESVGRGLKKHIFEPSPRMSTYLVAIAIGRLDSVSRKVQMMEREVTISIWGTPNRVAYFNHSLDIASSILPHYETLLQTPFPLPKLDYIAVPNYQGGGMENWGMIVFREAAILAHGQETTDAHNLRRIGEIIAHETAHMWFGDLVTMDWWGHLWLNEGFASYLEYIGATEAIPDGGYFDRFYVEDVVPALKFDASNSSHPLAIEEGGVEDGRITALFDKISYEKGGAVLRMLRTFLNKDNKEPFPMRRRLSQSREDDVFLTGVSEYLNAHKFGSTNSKDLWSTMDKVSGKPISEWMQRWTYQSGFPILNVNLDGNNVMVSQIASDTGECSEDSAFWIPIRYKKESTEEAKWKVLDGCQTLKLATLSKKGESIVVNADRFGLYRVFYDTVLEARLLDAMSKKGGEQHVKSVDVAGMLSDAFELSFSDRVDVNISAFMDLTVALGSRMDTASSPWKLVLSYLTKIHHIMQQRNASCAENLSAYVTANLTQGMLKNVSNPVNSTVQGLGGKVQKGEPLDYRLLRSEVLLAAGSFEDERVINKAKDAFASKMDVHPDVKDAIYRMAVAHGHAEVYNEMKELYLNSIDFHDKVRFLNALGYAKDPKLLNETLYFTLTDDVKSQDASRLLSLIGDLGGNSTDQTLEFIMQEARSIGKKYGDLPSDWVTRLLQSVGQWFATDEMASRIKDFVMDNSDVFITHPMLDTVLGDISENVKWLDKHGDVLCEWLDRRLL